MVDGRGVRGEGGRGVVVGDGLRWRQGCLCW